MEWFNSALAKLVTDFPASPVTARVLLSSLWLRSREIALSKSCGSPALRPCSCDEPAGRSLFQHVPADEQMGQTAVA
jgi:hypothetical protein